MAMMRLAAWLFPRGLILAILSLLAQAALAVMSIHLALGAWTGESILYLALAVVLFLHCLFMVMLTDLATGYLQLRPGPLLPELRTGLIGASLLFPVLALLLAPLMIGQAYRGAYGQAVAWSIDDVPWLVITWAILTLFALPARAIAWCRGQRFGALPAWKIMLLMAPWFVIVELYGLPSQSCRGECWGFMEGGIVMVPLLGLHLFLASFSCALLSALAAVPAANARP